MSWSMRHQPTSVPSRLAAAGRGDQGAFSSLVHDLAPRLMALGLDVLGCPRLAEETLTRALVEAWRRAPTYDRSSEDAEAWFTALMHRHAVDALRTTTTTPATSAQRVRDRNTAAGLSALPEPSRRCLELAWFEGRTVTDVARQTRSDLDATCRRLSSGLRTLSRDTDGHHSRLDEAVHPAAG